MKKYSAVIRFLIIFLSAYAILTLVYNGYLEANSSAEPDPVTRLVALQSEAVVSSLGYESMIRTDPNFPLMNLFIDGKLVSRIVEGCNSISILILFLSFMLAFFGRTRQTLLYIFSGMVLIYAINVLRIAVLSVAIYELPHYTHFLHRIIFPLIIYGTTFLLWVLWIRIYAKSLSK